jgi:hypothetical protein
VVVVAVDGVGGRHVDIRFFTADDPPTD